MRRFKKAMSVMLVSAMLLSVPAVSAGYQVSAASAGTYSCTQTGNSGAVINCCAAVSYATVNDSSIATVSYSGKTVTVTGVSGAAGIAEVTIGYGTNILKIEIPIGYTTFAFNGDSITVYEGKDTKYEITGISSDGTEYTPEAATDADGNAVYTNTDQYSLSVNINKKGGTYAFTGTGNDMSIAVKKEATGAAVLLLSDLQLTSSLTSPITVKKNSTSTATITALEGHTNTLTDSAFNNADTYGDTADGGDGTNAEFAESAVIKGKSYSNITLNGSGTLNLVCNTKNALKVGDYGALTIEDLSLNVTSVKNGISSDNTLAIHSGTLNITAEADAIRTDPDAVDADAGCAGNIDITGGDITIQAGSDGIQSAQDINITGGNFNITTGSGYNDSSFNSDTMSCKGIKASYSADSIDTTDTSESTNTITISGGTFNLNTADDALHSDGYIVVTGGQFRISTGDDGVHADTSLTLGAENGSGCGVQMTVANSYEGLEAGNVYIYSGSYDVTASDDGINAAGGNGGSSQGFNPGGGPGGPGGHGGGFGGFGGNTGGQSGSTGNYSININGGNVKVNAAGDGIDSNGNLNLTGGNIISFGAAAGQPDDPLDADGNIVINGASVFAAGSSQMAEAPSSSSQNYITSKSTIQSGKTINVINNGSTVFNTTALRNVNYVLYSSPAMTSSSGWSITGDSFSLIGSDEIWHSHSFNSGTVTRKADCTTDGLKTYTCSDCGTEMYEAIAATGHTPAAAVTETGSDGCSYSVVYCSTCGEVLNRTKLADALVNQSSVNKTTAPVGAKIVITGAASGGTAPYTYAYYYKRSTNTKWNVLGTEFGTSASANFKPTAAAVFDVKAVVKDSSGLTSEKTFTVNITDASALQNGSVINSDIVQIGDKVRIAASASGGSGSYTYAYYFKRSTNSTWKVLGTEFGTDSSVTFTPTAAASYDIKVIVKDSSGATAEKTFTVTSVTELALTNASTVNKTSVAIGSAVKLTGKAVGGTSPYTYAFYFKRSTNTKWNVLGTEFGTTASAKLKPTAAASYDIKIIVKDSSGTTATKTFTVTSY